MRRTRNLYFLLAVVLFVVSPLLMGRLESGSIGLAMMTGGLMIDEASRTRKLYFLIAMAVFAIPALFAGAVGSLASLSGLAMVLLIGGLMTTRRA